MKLPTFIMDPRGIPFPRIPKALMDSVTASQEKKPFVPIYTTPVRKDVAVLLCFFNPAGFKRPFQNLLYVLEGLRSAEIPTYVIECVFEGREPQVPGATLVVRSKTPMFYKEQLLNLLESKVPSQYTKLAFLDGDVIFDAPDWVDQVSVALNTYTAIQPFDRASRLLADNKTIRSSTYNFAWGLANRVPIRGKHGNYTPGYAWAVRRDFLKRIGGLFDRKIIGAGDISFALIFNKGLTNHDLAQVTGQEAVLEPYRQYYDLAQTYNPTLTFLNVGLYHMFHGLRKDRNYETRYKKVQHILNSGWDTYMTKNTDGLYEITNPELRDYLVQYFQSRDEDIPYERSMNPAAKAEPEQGETAAAAAAMNRRDPIRRIVSTIPVIQRPENRTYM